MIQQDELNINNVLENLSPQGDRLEAWQGNLLGFSILAISAVGLIIIIGKALKQSIVNLNLFFLPMTINNFVKNPLVILIL